MRERGSDESFVGRATVLARLSELADATEEDGFRTALVLGEAGLGKTRLSQELLTRRDGHNLGLAARAFPLGGAISFGLWSDALDRHLRSLPLDDRLALAAGYATDLAGLLPSLGRDDVIGRDPARVRLLQGLARVVSTLARRAPLLVVLDDAHLADASSWEALGYLSRHVDDVPLLVVVNARPAELGASDAATRTLASLAGDGVLERLELEPLDRAAVGELTARSMGLSSIPDRLVDWVMERSRGNPLYATGLVDALVAEAVDPEDPHLDRLPEDLAERILAVTRVLAEPTQATLELMALLGQVGVEDLSRLAGRPLAHLATILDELVAARLVTEQQRGPEVVYEIVHPLVQQAIYDGVGSARRRALHRRVARELLAVGRASAAAPHFARGASPGDEEAIVALLVALRQAESAEAYHEAFVVQEAMLEIIPAGDERWLEVLDAMGGQTAWISDHRADTNAATGVRVLEMIRTVLELGELRDPSRLGPVYFRMATFLSWDMNEFADADAYCVRARDYFREAGDSESALLAEYELAFIRGRTRTVPEWLAEARTVLAGAEASHHEAVTMMALGQVAIAASWVGRLRESEELYGRSIEVAKRLRQAYRLSWNHSHHAESLALQGRCVEGAREIAEARRCYPAVWETLVPWAAWVSYLGGDFRGSLDAAEEYLSWGQGPIAIRIAPAVLAASAAAVERDLLDRAEQLLEQTRATFGGQPFFGIDPLQQWAQSLILVARGDGPSAVAGLRDASRSLIARGASSYAALVLFDRAHIAAVNGDPEEADDAAAALAAVAGSIDHDAYQGLAAAARGWAALARDDDGSARAAALDALAILETTEWRGHEARTRELLGRALARLDRPTAVQILHQVAGTYRELGAVRRADAVGSQLEGLGSAGRRSAASVGPAALSPREREVARLTAEGLTAREIADQLFIGRRTVETHLTNVYAKLGVGSKREFVRRSDEFHL